MLVMVHKPNVLLINSGMIGATSGGTPRALRGMVPGTCLVALTSSGTDDHADRAVRGGIAGCVLKNGDPYELIPATRAAAVKESLACVFGSALWIRQLAHTQTRGLHLRVPVPTSFRTEGWDRTRRGPLGSAAGRGCRSCMR
ncbi:hypothetical protein FB157_120184 [Streptomyces sp. BK340]|nr:hypothetical protein FB157_120184 [Streptomyces sp. BK340]